MIPIPQYPLYTATLALFDAKPIPYYLDEGNDWALDIQQLRENLHKARGNNIDVRALVIINPGNPTGQCLSFDNMKEVIELCYQERLVLMADEVYQTNIYLPETRPFHSFKKVLMSMDEKFHQLELISFHSISKGMIGECGRRGGYFELSGIDPKVVAQIYKIASVALCPNVPGQIMLDLMLHPPQKGDESYDLYQKEYTGIFESLQRRAIKLHEAFNSMEGITCNRAQGAMYLFPKVQFPSKFLEECKEAGKNPDDVYSMEMLNATGVCVIPGSGFQQVEGTYHFRSTFLPPEDRIDAFISNLKKFHCDFMAKCQ
ncbi:alanine transaminase [Entomophthora muscae]|uniref:Alanine transaminase n=1 Tax=Entomophthora muscae TaxID=34485 RepID=A0ACC2RY43_9FUNG|nr:alanine transaminase [Entomophthora muscae]